MGGEGGELDVWGGGVGESQLNKTPRGGEGPIDSIHVMTSLYMYVG